MKKPYDRVTEAYYSELGEAFAHKTRNRIHWICEQAKGSRILDVGCSQGITSILLGREGKQVTGIDLLEQSITYAQKQLKQEESMTQENVEFIQANFINRDFEGEKFDVIIFGEVLEHISDPTPFLEKATSLLKDDGRIVVTLPFGINDYFDHKKTYYLMDLLRFQHVGMDMSTVKFFGKWIGAIFENRVPKEKSIQLNEDLLQQVEEQFEKIERMHLNTLQDKNKAVKELKNKVKQFNEEKTSLLEQLEQRQKEQEELQLQNVEYRVENSVQEREIMFLEKQQIASENLMKKVGRENDTLKEKNHDLDYEIKALVAEKESSLQKGTELEAQLATLKVEHNECKKSKEDLVLQVKELQDELTYEKQEKLRYEKSIQQYEKKLKEAQQKMKKAEQNSATDHLVKELNRQVILERKEKIKAKEQLVQSIAKERNLLNTFSRYQKQYKEEIQSLKARYTVALREKIDVKEQLQEAYQKESRILMAHQKLIRKYKALSESRLGRLTLAHWEKRTQKRNKAKRRSKS